MFEIVVWCSRMPREHEQLTQFDSHKICIKTDKQKHFAENYNHTVNIE